MTAVILEAPQQYDVTTDVVVVGAGAAGLTTALRAASAGLQVIVVERDDTPSGSTSLSSGFVPAAATRYQRKQNLTDSREQFRSDITTKSEGLSEPTLVSLAVDNIAAALEWLDDHCGMQWQVLDDFLYPGHSCYRMHAVPEKTGAALLSRLYNAALETEIAFATGALVDALFVDDQHHLCGVRVSRADNVVETIAARAIVLACNGYGGNRDLVQQHIPEIASGPYFGHAGNTGDAVLFGQALGASLQHLSGYQGHGSVAHPHGILITWALMMRGGFQVNQRGLRFSDESLGYSEQAVHVLNQANGVAWNIYDQSIHEFALQFDDYRQAVQAGAIVQADTLAGLSTRCELPLDTFQQTVETVRMLTDSADGRKCEFGRDFSQLPALSTPYCAVRVTGALFHTQGGLLIDQHCRALRQDGSAFNNLYAAGGAACGVSGPDVSGYLSGNGLLTALSFGYLAGEHITNVLSGDN